MKIGIFSGSFDPIHIGHIILGNYIVEYTEINEVWFLVTPHNPLKEQSDLIDENERLRMVELATQPYDSLKASDFEFFLPRPSYTIDTLNALTEKYPEHEFYLVIGGDNWDTFSRWKDYERIIKEYKIVVYPRLDSRLSIAQKLRNTVEALDSPIIEISSTFIREGLKDGKNMRPFLSPETYDYIEDKKLYKAVTS